MQHTQRPLQGRRSYEGRCPRCHPGLQNHPGYSRKENIFAITDNQQSAKYRQVGSLLTPAIDRIEELYNGKGALSGIPSGYSKLDEFTNGFQNSELIIIGARPSIGKTAFALSLASNISIKHKHKLGFFTLEMSDQALMMRILAAEARILSNAIRSGMLSKADFAALITPEIKGNLPRHEQVAEISRSLKALARELDIPIICLSQVGRQSEGKPPTLADLRESGSIEQDAEMVIFLHRDREENAEAPPTDVIIAKQRNGPIGTMQLAFLKQYARFEAYEKREEY